MPMSAQHKGPKGQAYTASQLRSEAQMLARSEGYRGLMRCVDWQLEPTADGARLWSFYPDGSGGWANAVMAL